MKKCSRVKIMSEFRARRSNYKLIKYTNGWDVYSFKTKRINGCYHVRLDNEYCFCRFSKTIFDSYSKTRKNTQLRIDDICFDYVLFWFCSYQPRGRYMFFTCVSLVFILSTKAQYVVKMLKPT